jgi:hypothetical protein
MRYTVAGLAAGRPPLGWKPDRRPKCSTLEFARSLEVGLAIGDLEEVPGPHGIPELVLTEKGVWRFSPEDEAL